MNEPLQNQPNSNQLTPGDAAPESGALPNPSEPPRAGRWDRAKFIFRAVEVRLRFIAVFVLIGLLMAYWTTIENYWDRWSRPATLSSALEADTEFYCPMHPSVVRDTLEPNGELPDCPICGMPLSKRKKGEAAALPEGVLSRVQLTPERIRMAGVETATVAYLPLSAEVRTVGYVHYDESRLSDIVTRVGGYIEELYVDKSFTLVEAGQQLAEIYSPELYSTAQELVLARKHGTNDLVENARTRLSLLGISASEIDQILESAKPGAQLLIRSPQSGYVIDKNIVDGASVQPGDLLFRVADLSTVWIEADVYERDLAILKPGQVVEATVEAFPGRTFQGEIALVYPELNIETRTNRIRVVIQNQDLLLRPGMFATVVVNRPVSETEPFHTRLASRRTKPSGKSIDELISYQENCPVTGRPLGSMGKPVKSELGDEAVLLCCEGCVDPLHANAEQYLARLAPPPPGTVLTVPERAVIDTGAQKIVYVEREPGLFEGVAVELGPRSGNSYPVLDGLAVGDKVVASGSFLLDAETRLNPAAAAAYFGASGNDNGGTSGQSGAQSSGQPRSAGFTPKELANIAKLSAEDQQLAKTQKLCPVTGKSLGWMGVPVKLLVKDTEVLLCCKACIEAAQKDPDAILKKIKAAQGAPIDRAATRSGTVHQH